MPPFDVAKFLQGVEQHRAEEAAEPDPHEEFAKEQFQGVVDAMNAASKAMLAFMKTYKPTVSVSNLGSIKTPDVESVVSAVKSLETALKPLQNDNSDVVAAIKGLELNPTYKPEINVSPTPVTVKAPVVKVDAPDLTPLQTAIEANKPIAIDFKAVLAALKDVSTQVKIKPTPVANTPTDPLIKYTAADIDDATNIQYFGFVDSSGAWYIRKFDESSEPKTIRFAFGQSAYPTNFINRASLTYKLWSQ